MVPSLQMLKNKGIEVDEDPRNDIRMPQSAEDLKQLLINFNEFIPDIEAANIERLCDRDAHLYNDQFPLTEAIYRDSGHATYKKRCNAAYEMRNKSKELQGRDRESTWNGFISNRVFQDINSQASEEGIPLRDLLSWGSEDLFTNASAIRGDFSNGQEHAPKPDFWFGLGLHTARQLSRVKGLELKEKGIDYFTQEKLKDIGVTHDEDLIYQPNRLRKEAAFPWMVVELKKEHGNRGECIRQAANGSYTCLKLCERLAAPTKKEVSPVVAFTSIGPEAKVYVTYKCEDEDENETYRMTCIWSGNIEHILHAVQLRRIVDQLQFWALRIFKPWVTECLDFWYAEEDEDDSEEESDEKTDEETEESSEEEVEDDTNIRGSKDAQTQTTEDYRESKDAQTQATEDDRELKDAHTQTIDDDHAFHESQNHSTESHASTSHSHNVQHYPNAPLRETEREDDSSNFPRTNPSLNAEPSVPRGQVYQPTSSQPMYFGGSRPPIEGAEREERTRSIFGFDIITITDLEGNILRRYPSMNGDPT